MVRLCAGAIRGANKKGELLEFALTSGILFCNLKLLLVLIFEESKTQPQTTAHSLLGSSTSNMISAAKEFAHRR